MTVKVLAFGIAREIFGAPVIEINIGSERADVNGLKAILQQQYPRLQQLSSYMVALNNEYAKGGATIAASDEIAIIPPVSGG